MQKCTSIWTFVNPTPLSEIQDTGYTTPAQITKVIHGLGLHQVQFILWESGNLGTLPGWAQFIGR